MNSYLHVLLHSYKVSRSRLFIQSLTFKDKNCAISVNPVKAKYGFKKDYISVIKNGYIFLEFMDIENTTDGRVNLGFF